MIPKEEAPVLQYFIAEQGPVQIITMVGYLVRENEPILEKCLKDALGRNAAWVIFNLRDLAPEIERTMFRTLVQTQKSLREKPKMIRICGLHPDLATLLLEHGVVRREEVFGNVAEVLMAIKNG